MGEFEDRLREAFDGELARKPAPPGLRQRVILNAVSTPRPGTRRFGAPAPGRVFAFGGALAAVAAIAVVAGSIGVALGRNGGPVAQASPHPSASSAPVAFGKLPPPNLNPPQGLGAGGGGPVVAIPYFGPAQMSWAGQLPQVPSAAPVFRFPTPGVAQADAFAAGLGAKLDSRGNAGQNRNYTGPDGFLTGVLFDGPEPTFVMLRDPQSRGSAGPTETVARAAANDFLSRNNLMPTWPYAILTSSTAPPQQAGPFTAPPIFPGFTVTYQRLIPLSTGGFAPEVDVNGDPAGVEVIVDPSGRVYRVAGPLPKTEQSGNYPLRAAGSSTVKEALASPPLVQQQSGPVPSVVLTRAQLVYTAVRSGTETYLEPGYLFSGTFARDGLQYEKRVLVPALGASVTTTG